MKYTVTNKSKQSLAFELLGGGYATLSPNDTRVITPPKPYSADRIKELDKAGAKVVKFEDKKADQ